MCSETHSHRCVKLLNSIVSYAFVFVSLAFIKMCGVSMFMYFLFPFSGRDLPVLLTVSLFKLNN